MKLSVSVPEEDVAVLDEYAHSSGLPSRSAALRHAIQLLRQAALEQAYTSAWSEWQSTGDQAVWEATTADGLADSMR
jgi:Arc/MetJ-type ribon-helix-helix transcriptional regulator